MTDTEVVAGTGAVERLAELVAGFAPRRILVVGTPSALARVEVERRLRRYRLTVFGDFRSNPQLADGVRGAQLAATTEPDLILGVGGGSAMDVAKLVRGLPPDHDAALAVLRGAEPVRRAPLVLVPTTAGTGSEVTGFATVYVDEVKYSLDHPSAHAELSIVDPELTYPCPADVSYSGALDALAHAIESLWSLRSTARSRQLASDALPALVAGLSGPLTQKARAALSGAATRAGLAIDQTRTTGGHAFAYPLTARFGVPHGLACALNLLWLLPFTTTRLASDCQDPRGVGFVRRRIDEFASMDLAELVRGAGFSPWLGDYGVTGDDLPWLVSSALGHGRSTNGPVRLDPEAVLPWLRQRLSLA